jgi:hypothetical protein
MLIVGVVFVGLLYSYLITFMYFIHLISIIFIENGVCACACAWGGGGQCIR